MLNPRPLLLVLVIILTSIFICSCSSAAASSNSSDAHGDDVEKDNGAVHKWKDNFKRFRKMMQTAMKMGMPYIMDSVTSEELVISPRCKHALFQWISDLRSMKPYALKLGDASAKMIDGILTGTLSAFGSYDQCVDTVSPKGDIHGKYCTVEAWPTLPPKPRFYAINQRLDAFKPFENDTGMLGEFTKYLQLFYNFPFRLGICVPDACSVSDIQNISLLVGQMFFPSNITVPRCETKEELIFENYQIPIVCVLAILVSLVVCGTITDVLLGHSKGDSGQDIKKRGYNTRCILSFSIIANWKMLIAVDTGDDSLSCLHGVRFFSMCWIIFGHTYLYLNFNVLKYLQITIELTSRFIFNTITNATLLVDNFFFMSGLLFIYIGMDISKKTGKIPNPFYFFIHRVWRFLPVQMFFVGISTLLPLMGGGPLWHENIDPVVDGCKRDWWTNFLFVNNLYRTTSRGCLSYTWYLGADFQVYVICIPLVILIMRKPKLGLWINFAVMVLSVVGVGIHNYVRDLPPALLFTRADVDQRNQLMAEAYYPPLHHLGPHCLGIFVGYYLKMKKSPKNLHWTIHLLAWVVTFTLTSASLYGVHPWNTGEPEPGIVATVLYASLSRMSWTIGLAWIVIACSTGCGGFIGSVLSWKPFIPFSRLSFMVYMVHPLIQFVFYSSLRDGIQARNALAIFIYLGYVVSSYVIAFFICFLLEAPFLNIGKIAFEIEEAIRKKKLTLKTLLTGEALDPQPRQRDSLKPNDLPRIANGAPNCEPLQKTRNGSSNHNVLPRYLHPQLSRGGVNRTVNDQNSKNFICHL